LHTSTWSMTANMLIPRSGAGCAGLNYKIFVCGGFDGHQHLPSVETYSTITGQWSMLCQLSISRCYCSATLLHGKIVVVGKMIFKTKGKEKMIIPPFTNLINRYLRRIRWTVTVKLARRVRRSKRHVVDQNEHANGAVRCWIRCHKIQKLFLDASFVLRTTN
jgi:hypothetical protein